MWLLRNQNVTANPEFREAQQEYCPVPLIWHQEGRLDLTKSRSRFPCRQRWRNLQFPLPCSSGSRQSATRLALLLTQRSPAESKSGNSGPPIQLTSIGIQAIFELLQPGWKSTFRLGKSHLFPAPQSPALILLQVLRVRLPPLDGGNWEGSDTEPTQF